MTDNAFILPRVADMVLLTGSLQKLLKKWDFQSETIGVAPVGCSVLMYDFMNVDMQQAAHGRAPAVATAIKRLACLKNLYLHIRAMATLLLSVLPKPFMPVTVEKTF